MLPVELGSVSIVIVLGSKLKAVGECKLPRLVGMMKVLGNLLEVNAMI